MAGLLVLFFPFVLLAFMILMERVEGPLRTVAMEDRVEEFLEEARPDEMDTFVRAGLPAALNEHDQRRKLARLLPRRPIRRGRHAAQGP
jgi:Na+-transporting methylmalonyl-CoA/oxaloacetate decarboxylase gamma subunit